MAKKSNKTEQVLKLITKEEEGQNPQEEAPLPEVEISVKPAEKKEHKIETKLKIEIEPEFEIKQQKKADEASETDPLAGYGGVMYQDGKVCLVNLTEHLVKESAKEVMKRLNVCDCNSCTLDVLALALNSLPNKFITTDAGKQYLKLETYKKQYETDIIAALARACVRVKASPRHRKQV